MVSETKGACEHCHRHADEYEVGYSNGVIAGRAEVWAKVRQFLYENASPGDQQAITQQIRAIGGMFRIQKVWVVDYAKPGGAFTYARTVEYGPPLEKLVKVFPPQTGEWDLHVCQPDVVVGEGVAGDRLQMHARLVQRYLG